MLPMKGIITYMIPSPPHASYRCTPYVVLHRHTAMDHAVKNGHTECSELLQQFGGVSVDQIRMMAAISIQTAFRAHR